MPSRRQTLTSIVSGTILLTSGCSMDLSEGVDLLAENSTSDDHKLDVLVKQDSGPKVFVDKVIQLSSNETTRIKEAIPPSEAPRPLVVEVQIDGGEVQKYGFQQERGTTALQINIHSDSKVSIEKIDG